MPAISIWQRERARRHYQLMASVIDEPAFWMKIEGVRRLHVSHEGKPDGGSERVNLDRSIRRLMRACPAYQLALYLLPYTPVPCEMRGHPFQRVLPLGCGGLWIRALDDAGGKPDGRGKPGAERTQVVQHPCGRAQTREPVRSRSHIVETLFQSLRKPGGRRPPAGSH